MIQQVTTRGMAEAIAEAAAEAYEEVHADEPCEFVTGPLGHLTDQLLDEALYSAAMWGEFFEDLHANTTDAMANAHEPTGLSLQQVFEI